MSRPTILLVYPLQDPDAHALLAEHADVIGPTGRLVADILSAIGDAPAVDAIIVRGPSFIGAEVMDAAPGLKIVAGTGSGIDYIDVAAATERGIMVTSGAGIAPVAVAEFVIGAMAFGHRDVVGLRHRMLDGHYADWTRRIEEGHALELAGSVLGVIGLGFIGRTVAARAAAAYDARVLGYDPYASGPGAPGVEMLDDLDVLLERSDTVSVHVPLNEATRGLLGRRRLDLIGPRGLLINASRGGIVDETDMCAALGAGTLGAAVVDVFEREPPNADDLARFARTPRLTVTPHVAGITENSRRRLAMASVESVLAALGGRVPAQAVNADVLVGTVSPDHYDESASGT